MSREITNTGVNLPALPREASEHLDQITSELGVPRNVVASDDQIGHVWENLPRLLSRIPAELRDAGMARMCIAVSSGLFDSGINYIWNGTVVELARRVRAFGIPVVQQVTSNPKFDERVLSELQDSQLLDLCLKVNIISEEGYYKLSQCRDMRNNLSAAHPAIGDLDEDEFINFVNRCSRFALNPEPVVTGVDVSRLIGALKGGRFTAEQTAHWAAAIHSTHSAQRSLVFGMLHSVYCDPSSKEETRLNCLALNENCRDALMVDGLESIVTQHQEYVGKGEQERHKASSAFFESLAIVSYLAEPERHALMSSACRHLLQVHQQMNNFYNEPPFAERLLRLSSQQSVPESVRDMFVGAVMTCAVGNQYGVSWEAGASYDQMIRNFSPDSIRIMIRIPNSSTLVASRIKTFGNCRARYVEKLRMISIDSVPTNLQSEYRALIEVA